MHKDNLARYEAFYRIAGNWQRCYDTTLLRGMLLAIEKHNKTYDGLTNTEMHYRTCIADRVARFSADEKLRVAT